MMTMPVPGAAPSRPPWIGHEYVRWRDVDPVGIMRYDAYLRLVELGEEELVRAAGMPWAEGTATAIWLPRKLVHVEYHRPSRLGDRVAVVSYISRLGHTSLTLHVDVMSADGGTLLVETQMVVVAATTDGTLTKVALPEELRRAAEPWSVPPAEARARAAERLAGG